MTSPNPFPPHQLRSNTPMDKAFIAPGLDFYINNPTMMLPFEAVNEIGLDGNGHDGNERFPYTWGNLTAAERTRLRTAAAHQDVVDDVEDDEYDEYDTVVYYPVADAAPDSTGEPEPEAGPALFTLASLQAGLDAAAAKNGADQDAAEPLMFVGMCPACSAQTEPCPAEGGGETWKSAEAWVYLAMKDHEEKCTGS